ncbi:MAG: hypothetical protein AVDCRST_MAG34-1591, partial [uncultured Nocardioidaceae bacterium]
GGRRLRPRRPGARRRAEAGGRLVRSGARHDPRPIGRGGRGGRAAM